MILYAIYLARVKSLGEAIITTILHASAVLFGFIAWFYLLGVIYALFMIAALISGSIH